MFVPDCGDIGRERWKSIYAFGKRHCMAFDKNFFSNSLASMGFNIIEIKERALNECELMVIAKKG